MTADALPAGAPTPEPQPCENTDRELWRERDGDFYAPSIHVTASGGIGINVGGSVVVMPVQAWHRLAAPASGLRSRQTRDEDGQRASAEALARRFHETYERLAPSFGYATRPESAKPWSDVPDQNRHLMIAVCAELLAPSTPQDEGSSQ